jgi:hypothetical protein
VWLKSRSPHQTCKVLLGERDGLHVEKRKPALLHDWRTTSNRKDFKRQIEARFGTAYSKAWKESLEIVRQYPRDVSLFHNGFFQDVYKQRRDEVASKWTKMSE